MTPQLATLVDQVVDAAWKYLIHQSALDFPETRHVMSFPRAAGFSGTERQSSDIFARAILGILFDDIARLAPFGSELATDATRLRRQEAERLASRKMTARAGGWSYFPDLPELPADLDSLSAALSLFARVAPEYLPLCMVPLATVLNSGNDDGSFETWIVPDIDAETDRARARWGVDACWGRGPDPDVLASFCTALMEVDAVRHRPTAVRVASWLARAQRGDGSWTGTWYHGSVYTTALAIRAIERAGIDSTAVARGRAYLLSARRDDGAWGDPIGLPLDTAMALWGLGAETGGVPAAVADAAVNVLAGNQNPDGSWFSSPWIQMPIGRATGQAQRTALWESVTISTAFCVRTFCAIRRASR